MLLFFIKTHKTHINVHLKTCLMAAEIFFDNLHVKRNIHKNIIFTKSGMLNSNAEQLNEKSSESDNEKYV